MIKHILQLKENNEYVLTFADNTQISTICKSIEDTSVVFVNYSTCTPINVTPSIDTVCVFEDTDDDYTFNIESVINNTSINSLIGCILTSVIRVDDSIQFFIDDKKYKIAHHQVCCEIVYLDDVIGDLQDIENTIILDAKETISKCGAYFYDIRSIKGSVTLRFILFARRKPRHSCRG